MIRRLVKKATCEPRNCAEGKTCERCKPKRTLEPQIYLEEPRRLPIPIVISHYRHNPTTTVQVVKKPRRWGVRRKPTPTTQPTVRKRQNTAICRWYKRNKALRELKQYEQRQQKARAKREREQQKALEMFKKNQLKEQQEQERREREHQVYEHYKMRAEREKIYDSPVISSSYETEKVPKQTIKINKAKKMKASKTSSAKPKATSKFVAVKRRSYNDRRSTRFVNCVYRVCCQFYCYLTCFIIIGCVIIFVL